MNDKITLSTFQIFQKFPDQEIAQSLFDVVKFDLKIKFVNEDDKPFWTVENKS